MWVHILKTKPVVNILIHDVKVNMQILRDPLKGGGPPKRLQGGWSLKEHRGSRSQGGGACEKIGQTEGAQKENNYSQDQVSMDVSM